MKPRGTPQVTKPLGPLAELGLVAVLPTAFVLAVLALEWWRPVLLSHWWLR